MKILFVLSSLGQGGAERVMVQLANGWAGKHDIHLLTIKGPEHDFFTLDEKVKRHSINVERKKWYNFGIYFKLIGRLKNTIKRIKPDFVVSFVIKTNIFTLMARVKNTPVIVCEHNILGRKNIDIKQETLRKVFYKRAHRIGVLTKSIKEDFHKRYPTISSQRVIVMPNPVDIPENIESFDLTQFFDSDRESIKIVISLGRLVPVKNYGTMIDIFSEIIEERPEYRLLIFGDGPYRKEWESKIESMGLRDKIKLPGYIQNTYGAIAGAEVNASTSQFEGFPMTIVESMAIGTPCIGFDVPGVRDLIESQETGILVTENDTSSYVKNFLALIDNRALYSQIRENGQESMKQYSMDAVTRLWFSEVLV
jgi:GalNAc-alpha-(1->4)-GalNAc-alpha-(1->3)-diNAcBac-PP-undecaprenol alpha-1,4-N-acetyl-D-galactosaminyltransferase